MSEQCSRTSVLKFSTDNISEKRPCRSTGVTCPPCGSGTAATAAAAVSLSPPLDSSGACPRSWAAACSSCATRASPGLFGVGCCPRRACCSPPKRSWRCCPAAQHCSRRRPAARAASAAAFEENRQTVPATVGRRERRREYFLRCPMPRSRQICATGSEQSRRAVAARRRQGP